mgnify:CR=1 FL=1
MTNKRQEIKGDFQELLDLVPEYHVDPFAGLSFTDLAARLGVSVRQVHRYREEGVAPRAMDRIATAVDLHPSAVWPREWEAHLAFGESWTAVRHEWKRVMNA